MSHAYNELPTLTGLPSTERKTVCELCCDEHYQIARKKGKISSFLQFTCILKKIFWWKYNSPK